MKRYCLALDLKDDAALTAAYKEHHQKVWPEILESIKVAGIESCEIYAVGNRLFMLLETNDTFSWERKAELDAANPAVQEWEALMWKYQQALPWAGDGEKWMLTEKIFELK